MHISNCNTVIHYWHFRPIKFISLGVLTWLSANKALRTKTAGTSLKNIDSLSSFLSVSLWWNFSAFKNSSCLPEHESKMGKIYFICSSMYIPSYLNWWRRLNHETDLGKNKKILYSAQMFTSEISWGLFVTLRLAV